MQFRQSTGYLNKGGKRMNKWILVLTVIAIAALTAGCINGPPYIVREDMNNDGLNDTIITQYDSAIDVIYITMDGSGGSFSKEITRRKIEKASTIVFDLNKDGKHDVIYKTSYVDGSWEVLYGKGDGTFEDHRELGMDEMQAIKNYKSN